MYGHLLRRSERAPTLLYLDLYVGFLCRVALGENVADEQSSDAEEEQRKSRKQIEESYQVNCYVYLFISLNSSSFVSRTKLIRIVSRIFAELLNF